MKTVRKLLIYSLFILLLLVLSVLLPRRFKSSKTTLISNKTQEQFGSSEKEVNAQFTEVSSINLTAFSELHLNNGFIVSRYQNTNEKEHVFNSYRESTLNSALVRGNKLILSLPYLGVGNQLFQYASALAISIENKRAIEIFQNDDHLSKYMKLTSSFTNNYSREKYIEINYAHCCIFNKIFFNLPPENIVLKGYFQSWKYFEKHRNIIWNEFTFSHYIKNQVKEFFTKLQVTRTKEENLLRIGIHIRRGDFLKDELKNYGFTVATKLYIHNAISYFKTKFAKTFFVVATNDKNWSLDAMSILPRNEYMLTEMTLPFTDIAILSSCEHVITTTGSFSWWIGYLSKGIVIYYKDFPRNDSTFAQSFRKEDYYPSHWIPMT